MQETGLAMLAKSTKSFCPDGQDGKAPITRYDPNWNLPEGGKKLTSAEEAL
jgi:hypothetical protein